MFVDGIHIHQFRNIQQAKLQLSHGMNLIYGLNGSGKTAVLEALFYLNTGRSFRCHKTKNIINYQSDKSTITATLTNKSTQEQVSLGVQKAKDEGLNLRVNRKPGKNWAELARWLPLQLITPESLSLMIDGPGGRRSFIDWGVFYTQDSYQKTWAQFKYLLKQRNALLKQKQAHNCLEAWNTQLIHFAEQVTSARASYSQNLVKTVQPLLEAWFPEHELRLTYFQGWDKSKTFKQALINSQERDKIQGYTQIGPQKADLKIVCQNEPVDQVLSRGQLKLLVCALKIAQSMLLHQTHQKQAVFLIDDLASELDKQHRSLILEQLTTLDTQTILTTIEPESITELLSRDPQTLFHVKQGAITAQTNSEI
jgi:DNA replication and repair protein RecF